MTELLYVAHIGLWIAVVLQGFAICVLVYRNSQLLKVAAAGSAIGGHATGTDAPAFEAKNLRTGEIVSHRQMGGQMGGQRTFLLFVTPSCSDCRKLMAELASLMEKLATATDGNNTFTGLVIYCDGANRGCLNAYPNHLGTVPVFVEHNVNVHQLFGVRALPALVELDHAWHIVAYSYPSSAEDVRRVVPIGAPLDQEQCDQEQ